MVLQKHGDRLYCGLRDTVEEHLVTVAEKIIATEDESFLERLNTCWKDHEANMVMIHDILMYMVRCRLILILLFFFSFLLFSDNNH